MSLDPILAALALFLPVLILLGLAIRSAEPADDHPRVTPPRVPEEEGRWLRLG